MCSFCQVGAGAQVTDFQGAPEPEPLKCDGSATMLLMVPEEQQVRVLALPLG